MLEAATGATVTDLYGGLDDLFGDALDLGQAVSENGSYISGALASLIMFLVAALMATISIAVICAAKLMIAVLIVPRLKISTFWRSKAKKISLH